MVGEHKDLYLLLLQHAEMNVHELFLKSEPKNLTQQAKSWCIKETKESQGPDICDNIFFIHAFLSCDATSRLYGLGKGLATKEIKKAIFHKQAEVFNSAEAKKGELVEAEDKALVSLYRQRTTEYITLPKVL